MRLEEEKEKRKKNERKKTERVRDWVRSLSRALALIDHRPHVLTSSPSPTETLLCPFRLAFSHHVVWQPAQTRDYCHLYPSQIAKGQQGPSTLTLCFLTFSTATVVPLPDAHYPSSLFLPCVTSF